MKNLVCRYDLDQRNEEESIQLAIDLLFDYNSDVANEYIRMLDGGDEEVCFEDVMEDLELYAMKNCGHSAYVEESQLYILDESKA